MDTYKAYKARLKPLLLLILLHSLADAVCTATGISIGVISEGNPLLTAINSRPMLGCFAAFVYTSGLLFVIYKLGDRCRFTMPLLIGLCAVKIAVMGLHVIWIGALL